jgi:hypothetical protein
MERKTTMKNEEISNEKEFFLVRWVSEKYVISV